jgi:acyl-CoA thioesterase
MVDLRSFLRRDRFAAHAGARLLSVSPGRARARMRLSARHMNGVDVAQGGAVFTLADLAFAAAANSHGTVAVAVNVAISFVKAAAKGTLTAEAREVARSARLSTCVVRVTDGSGDLVALFNGTAYRKKETLDEVRRARTARPGRKGAAARLRRGR